MPKIYGYLTHERRLSPTQAIASQFIFDFVSDSNTAGGWLAATGADSIVPLVGSAYEGLVAGCGAMGVTGTGGGEGCAASMFFLKGFPQFLQNLLVSGFWVPHSPQNILSLYCLLMPVLI